MLCYLYVKEARRRKGVTGLILLQLLVMRLDSLCFILGFAPTISSARQLVNHGHITVNGEVITIPSFQCRLKDRISIKSKKSSNNLITKNLENKRFTELPNYLKIDKVKLEAEIVAELELLRRSHILSCSCILPNPTFIPKQ